MSEGLGFTIFIAAFLTVIVAPIVGLAMWVNAAQCSSQASKMELEHSWGPLQDCMIRVDGKFMPLDSYKAVKLRDAR